MVGVFTREFVLTTRRQDTLDADGRPVTTTSVSVVPGAYRHRLAFDNTDAGMVTQDEWIAYMPPETRVEPGDLVGVDGEVLEVVSQPFPVWNHRTAEVHHLEIRLRRGAR